ncbi:hypothetical protein J1614_012138 [Plenodomus biglobosus]|nr:hypothetical protein J1614_012138 [Plenodomus biglobosus]
MIGRYCFLLFAIAWCAGGFQPALGLTEDSNLFQADLDNASTNQNHLYARNYIRYDPMNTASEVILDELTSWAWHELTPAGHARQFFDYCGWKEAIDSFESKSESRSCRPIRMVHADPNAIGPRDTQHYIGPDKNFYWPTGAQTSFVIDSRLGMIFIGGFNNVKSTFEAVHKYRPSNMELPKLRHLSDLVWVYWNRYHGKNQHNVKHFAVGRITSLSSRQIIASALRKHGNNGMIPPWPGVTFTRDEKQGKALIGSLGMSCAQLLYAHKDTLGNKHIPKVTVFREPFEEWCPQVLFYVELVPDDLQIPQEDPGWQPYPPSGPQAAPGLDSRTVVEPDPYKRDNGGNIFRVHHLVMD